MDLRDSSHRATSHRATSLRAIWAVFRFEFGRTLIVRRLAVAAFLALFPVAMVLLIGTEGRLATPFGAAVALYVLVVEVICLMGLLLWATPVILSELEGRTWNYLAVRPAGKGAVLLGKYLAAVTWTAMTAWTSLSICLIILQPQQSTWHLWIVLSALIWLSCLAYGALFVLLGVLFIRRGMVVAVAYTFIIEVIIPLIPAMINQLSVQYYLRNLGMRWFPADEWAGYRGGMYVSDASAWQHLLVLAGVIAVLLTVAVLILRRRELVTDDHEP